MKFTDAAAKKLPENTLSALHDILALDPRPGYGGDESKIYRFEYSDYKISFSVKDQTLTVLSAEKK